MIINQKLVDAVVERVKQKMNSTYSPEAAKMRRLETEVRTLRSRVAQLQKQVEEITK
jgi:outer membrane murein-binding lipoprotein Lpp